MKKLILAGIVIIIGCLIFIIIQQNTSQADIESDIGLKTYFVPFHEWVHVWLSAMFNQNISNISLCSLSVAKTIIEGKLRYRIIGSYKLNEFGKRWYQEIFPDIKEAIRLKCQVWTKEGYPISLNDFEFDIEAIQ